ncbi:MAG: NAD(P)/FAD-dependent oxidoreductase [Acidobacteria bacterium]|nr:NAD(P)/FAD-dependent oxidoreductase [Acidobacteriota bacterium]
MSARVAIIGAGPAGCSAALRCGELGVPVVLFESGERYRDKPCGDALIESAIWHAQRFGLVRDRLQALGGRPFHEIQFGRIESASPRRSWPCAGGWVISRATFDQALRDAVSRTSEVRYGESVAEVSPDGAGVNVRVSRSNGVGEHFRAAILATGAASRLTKNLGMDGTPTHGVAFRGYVHGAERRSGLLVELTSSPTGEYRWMFPGGTSANVGACRLGHPLDKSKASSMASLRSLAGGFGLTKLAGGVLPLWSGQGRKWHHPAGIVSCGDCAGLVNPMTGEGITAAFLSGEMAAYAVAMYLEDGNVRSLEQFSTQLGETFLETYTAHKGIVLSALASLD